MYHPYSTHIERSNVDFVVKIENERVNITCAKFRQHRRSVDDRS